GVVQLGEALLQFLDAFAHLLAAQGEVGEELLVLFLQPVEEGKAIARPILVVADNDVIQRGERLAKQDWPGNAAAEEGRLAQGIGGEGDVTLPQPADNGAAAGILHLDDHARPSCRTRMFVTSSGKASLTRTTASSARSKSAFPGTRTSSCKSPAATFACRSSFKPRAPRKSITSRLTSRLGHRSNSPIRKKACTRSSGSGPSGRGVAMSSILNGRRAGWGCSARR